MLDRIELRWRKGADQDLFILSVVFNPYIRASCFNREALSMQDIINMATRTFARLFQREPEPSFISALERYLGWEGEYSEHMMGLPRHLDGAKAQGIVSDTLFIYKSENIDQINIFRTSIYSAYGVR